MPSTEKKPQAHLVGVIDKFLDEKHVDDKDTDTEFLSIIDFIERFKLLPNGLYPVQKFILKLYYNLPLDDKEKSIKITDRFNSKVLGELTEVEYLEYLSNQGRCNIKRQDKTSRHELILVIGRRSGKCVEGDTLVFTDRGVIPIRELGDPDGPQWQDLCVEVAQEGSRKSKSHKFYVGGKQSVKRVTTYAGYEICGTREHRIKTLNENGDIVWKKLGKIKTGDFIGIHRESDLWSNEYVDVRKFHKSSPFRELTLPDFLDERWGRLLGILTGDGCWTYHNCVSVAGGCEELRVIVGDVFEELFGYFSLTREKKKFSTCPLLPWGSRVFSVPSRAFLHDLGWTLGCKPADKHIPWVIMKSPKSVVSAYLSGLYETDGGLEKKGTVISLCSASKRLIREVQILLINFGIVSKIRIRYNKKYKRNYYALSVLGYESRVKFAEQIGFLTDRKNKELVYGIEHGSGGHSDTELIPYQRKRLRKLVESIPISHNNTRGVSVRYRTWLREACGNCTKPNSHENPSYDRLRRIIKLGEQFKADPEILSELSLITETNYYWDRVVSISNERCPVYDLNVPDGESFVANGMTNHNSTISALIAAYEMYKLLRRRAPQKYYGMPSNSEIRILCIANDKEQASIVYGDMAGYVESVDYFKTSIMNKTQTFMKFQTDNDRQRNPTRATLTATFKSSIAKGLRGRGLICYILDEIAFFIEGGNSSAERIYRAINPSIAQFSQKDPKNKRMPLGSSDGRAILISSPDARDGFFYRQYQLSLSSGIASKNMLMIQAPTWEVNPTIHRSFYEVEYNKDPNAFMTEYGAEFSDRVRGWIEDRHDLLDCIKPELKPLARGGPRELFWAGVDFGLIRDGTAIALFHFVNGKIELAYHEVWYAGRNWNETNPHLTIPVTNYAKSLASVTRLDVAEIAEWFRVLSTRFYIERGVFDQWAGPIFEQELHRRGLKQFEMRNFSVADSSHAFHTTKMCLFSRQISLYDYPPPPTGVITDSTMIKHSPLIAELLELQTTSGGKNISVVEAPQVVGKHDDMSDAFVRGVLLATEYMKDHPGVLEASIGHLDTRIRNTHMQTYAGYHLKRRRLHGIDRSRPAPMRTIR